MKLTFWDEESIRIYRVAQILDQFKVKWKIERLTNLYRRNGRTSMEREVIADRLVDSLKSATVDTKSAIKWLDKRLLLYDV